ncbi:hypothetical protein NDU88_002860 [Pleurodeles waltl]|uniref:Uncharacterized protein n=1 Tax=Pleurodeles waltl TaxID=8319 RepID=A0AAV7SDW3_PLEWA|nr:hypothetical protein NDU88_002860 [Pleurodeles waltl]
MFIVETAPVRVPLRCPGGRLPTPGYLMRGGHRSPYKVTAHRARDKRALPVRGRGIPGSGLRWVRRVQGRPWLTVRHFILGRRLTACPSARCGIDGLAAPALLSACVWAGRAWQGNARLAGPGCSAGGGTDTLCNDKGSTAVQKRGTESTKPNGVADEHTTTQQRGKHCTAIF